MYKRLGLQNLGVIAIFLSASFVWGMENGDQVMFQMPDEATIRNCFLDAGLEAIYQATNLDQKAANKLWSQQEVEDNVDLWCAQHIEETMKYYPRVDKNLFQQCMNQKIRRFIVIAVKAKSVKNIRGTSL